MTTEENARELFYRISLWVEDKDTAIDLAELFSRMMLENAGMIWGCNQEKDEFINYWQEVKKEIENYDT